MTKHLETGELRLLIALAQQCVDMDALREGVIARANHALAHGTALHLADIVWLRRMAWAVTVAASALSSAAA